MTPNRMAIGTLALLAACGSKSDRPSAEQNSDMNEVAAMLNEAPADLANVDDGELNQTSNADEELPPSHQPVDRL